MEEKQLNKILELHQKWINKEPGGERADLRGADLRGADLRGVDLWGADLRGADLRGADLDYSYWPLWCGSLGVRVCKRIAAQLAYHFCRLDCDDPEVIAAQNAIIPLANQFHRADECGKLEPKEVKQKSRLPGWVLERRQGKECTYIIQRKEENVNV